MTGDLMASLDSPICDKHLIILGKILKPYVFNNNDFQSRNTYDWNNSYYTSNAIFHLINLKFSIIFLFSWQNFRKIFAWNATKRWTWTTVNTATREQRDLGQNLREQGWKVKFCLNCYTGGAVHDQSGAVCNFDPVSSN